ncbi:hypothetical protein [Saccharothrix obliqua]|uniref:hypothetical protein n=1 Tax=Saccharothrix obliqua TaxID=2861747 RepID=UPI001C5F8E37|nr:hypothetical protein [Saccharothrix obliqua]MBW4720298.1 hypothetical protein [Saccharothrix obliqua]
MFKKFRDRITAATQEATTRAVQDFQQEAARFQEEAARQGHHIVPQVPTTAMAAQAFQTMQADPGMAAFLALPAEEQMRQQREANAYGQELRRLHETGLPATAVIRTLDPTGTLVVGQQQYTSVVDVTPADGAPYQATITHLVPAMAYSQYTPGTRHLARIDPADPAKVAVFELIA